jgi:hypothetical protein
MIFSRMEEMCGHAVLGMLAEEVGLSEMGPLRMTAWGLIGGVERAGWWPGREKWHWSPGETVDGSSEIGPLERALRKGSVDEGALLGCGVAILY